MFYLTVVILDSGCTLEAIWGFWQIIDTIQNIELFWSFPKIF